MNSKLSTEEMRRSLDDANLKWPPTPIVTPKELREKHPLTDDAVKTVYNGRESVKRIIEGKDSRKLVIVGPCSIHNSDEALNYAREIKSLAAEVEDQFLMVMRTYLEKPRTGCGWPGLMVDPDLDGSCNVNKGVELSRKLLVQLAELGLPTATETLDPHTVQYISDLVTWTCIGARTVESQTHRRLAAGLSAPVGVKNGTSGDIETAVNALKVIRSETSFVGMDGDGRYSKVDARGNSYCHIILRGGHNGEPHTNYDTESVRSAQEMLGRNDLPQGIVIDCSHGNALRINESTGRKEKDYRMQIVVFNDVINQIIAGNSNIIGLMLESNINEGKQEVPKGLKDIRDLRRGVSITDACINLEETKRIIMGAYQKLKVYEARK